MKAEIPIDRFDSFIRATRIDSFQLSDYPNEITNTLANSVLSIPKVRQNQYNAGFHQNFDLVANEDAGFMELTIVYLKVVRKRMIINRSFFICGYLIHILCSLGLMSSPNSPLNIWCLSEQPQAI